MTEHQIASMIFEHRPTPSSTFDQKIEAKMQFLLQETLLQQQLFCLASDISNILTRKTSAV